MDLEASPGHPYQQVAAKIASKIAGGDLRPGERLAPVRQLAAEYGTTNATVQRSLAVLVEEGWITRIPNVGVYVRNPDATAPPVTTADVMKALDDLGSAVADLRQRVERLEGGGAAPVDQQPR
ncbi:DNA-binding GntR family transcriptional regulator [Saccharothrix tamanrassetensis]|uniref:DNA-binding GntR family transcriptional regulator n=1 Tax=Saccharothrix tamanrassetensis TaxID=1051531 RepID=A0A841CPZ6_9PSEU|nr:GntR family transcriptional regulator [Saccharothrix tamanrassetensis]MBB5958983.1 DNA-binding GntR family transcriptional regulator [Saccharothrix tamanrassetensis]